MIIRGNFNCWILATNQTNLHHEIKEGWKHSFSTHCIFKIWSSVHDHIQIHITSYSFLFLFLTWLSLCKVVNHTLMTRRQEVVVVVIVMWTSVLELPQSLSSFYNTKDFLTVTVTATYIARYIKLQVNSKEKLASSDVYQWINIMST